MENTKENSLDLLSCVAHELRNPTAAILNLSDMMVEELNKLSEELQKINLDLRNNHEQLFENINFIKSLSSDSLEMMTDILEMKKIAKNGEAIVFSDELKEMEIDSIVSKAIKINSSSHIRRKVNIVKNIEFGLKVKCSEKVVRQCLINLISNAIKYSPLGGVIKVNAYKNLEKNRIEIAVIDQGCGMKQWQLKKIFTGIGFGELSSKREDSFGIGLYLVKKMVESQGGGLVIDSQVGCGTKAVICFN